MNPLDGIIIGILLFFFIMGLLKGWFIQILQIGVIAVSFITAALLHTGLASSPVFNGIRQKSDDLAAAAAFMIIFLAISIFLTIVSALVFDIGRPDRLSFPARILGALIATTSGILILGCICLVASEWKEPGEKNPEKESFVGGLIANSALVPELSKVCGSLIDVLIPDSFREHGKDLIDAGKEQIKDVTGD